MRARCQIVIGSEQAAENGLEAQDAEDVARHILPVEFFRFIVGTV